MKRALVILFCLSVVLAGSVISASAGSAPRMWANIPFAFYAGDQLLQAGEYVFEMPELGRCAATGSTLAVRTRDGSVCVYLLAMPFSKNTSNPACHVTFTKYGNSHFLSNVQNNDTESSLPKTRFEKKTAIEYAKLAGGKELRQVAAASFKDR